MVSLAYPVRFYACAQECGWRGLLPSASGRDRRKRQLRVLPVALGLVLGAGLVVWQYRSDIVGGTEQPVPGDGIEEVGGGS
jgi:hypothetical protein